MENAEKAEYILGPLFPSDPTAAAMVALAHAMLAVVERLDAVTDVLDDLSCIVAVPSVVPDEDDEENAQLSR